MAKKVPQSYTQRAGQKQAYEVPGTYTEKPSDSGEITDPVQIFKAGFESGGYNVSANLNYFSALETKAFLALLCSLLRILKSF